MFPRRMDDVGLHHEVFIKELRPVGVVGMDAANFRCGEVDLLGFSFSKNASTACWSVRSSSARVRVIMFEIPFDCKWRTMADPTMPRCPATKIFIGDSPSDELMTQSKNENLSSVGFAEARHQ